MSAASLRWCAAVLLAASLALAQQTAGPADPATGSIEGAVFNAATGEPIRKADVQLNGSGMLPTNLRAGTDASGRFAFRALPAGTYWMSAQHPGYSTPMEAREPVTLSQGEQKSGIELRLAPMGSISGKVVDEFGAPVAHCFVGALRQAPNSRRRGMTGGNGITSESGEYLIQSLERGSYYVSLRCSGEIEAPHPLMKARDALRPTLVYPPQFYPGTPDSSAATRLRVTPGVETQGVDFQVRRVPAVVVRVFVDGLDLSQTQNLQVQLLPPGLDMAGFGASRDTRTGEYQFHGVTPGSYTLMASTFGNGPIYQAQMPVQVGATPPEPIHLVLAPGVQMRGTVEMEGANSPSPENLQVYLQPLGMVFTQPPQAQVNKDGTFTLQGVTSGKWRLNLGGAAYVKALSIADKDVSPYAFELSPGTAGPMRIVASNNTAQVQVTVSTPPDESDTPASYLLVPLDADRLDAGLVRFGLLPRRGQSTIQGVVPGRYRLYVMEGGDTRSLQERPEVLKALESRAGILDVTEGQSVQATAELIEARQLKEALGEQP